jgi:hypothetical protein
MTVVWPGGGAVAKVGEKGLVRRGSSKRHGWRARTIGAGSRDGHRPLSNLQTIGIRHANMLQDVGGDHWLREGRHDVERSVARGIQQRLDDRFDLRAHFVNRARGECAIDDGAEACVVRRIGVA